MLLKQIDITLLVLSFVLRSLVGKMVKDPKRNDKLIKGMAKDFYRLIKILAISYPFYRRVVQIV